MVDSFLIYLLPAVQVLFPGYLVLNLWIGEFADKSRWLWAAITALGVLLFFYLIGRWDIIGYPLRRWLYGAYFGAVVLSGARVVDLPFFASSGRLPHWSSQLDVVVLLLLLAWTFTGLVPGSPGVNLRYPLKGSSYYVAHGGSVPVLNYHGLFATSQRHALDISQLNDWGFRASGLYPSDPAQYAIFGDTVYSPLGGMVVAAVDSLRDQHPPRRLEARPAGNHLWIRRDSLYVLLAHLKHASVSVQVGDEVSRGKPLARVGNTGNSTAPHLHIQAIRYSHGSTPSSDSLLVSGTPVPILFVGRYLTRNDTFGAGRRR